MKQTGNLQSFLAWKVVDGPIGHEQHTFLDLAEKIQDGYVLWDPGKPFTDGQQLYIDGIGDVTVVAVSENGMSCNIEYEV